MMQKNAQILDGLAEKYQKAKRARTLNQSVKPVQVNGNGTNGYLIKSGKNKGKILGYNEFSLGPILNLPCGQRVTRCQNYLLLISHKAPGPLLNK